MMSDTHFPGPRVSMFVNGSVEGSVNDTCHSYTGGVKTGQKHIMRNPRVVIIFWGHYYATNPNVVEAAVLLISELVSRPFMNGLVQYGVGRGSVAGHFVIDTDTDQSSPAPTTFSEDQVPTNIKSWYNARKVTLAPSVDEMNLLYFIFPPISTEIKVGDLSTKSPDPKKSICGYHLSGKFNDASQNDDLFWAIVGTDQANQSTGKKFANSIAFCISHELAEAFTNRDTKGYVADNGCEIGDICELNTDHPWFQYRGWRVEQYWSNWDNNCIHGDQPVSLRKFLGSIGFNFGQGLRSLNTPVINLQYIASRE